MTKMAKSRVAGLIVVTITDRKSQSFTLILGIAEESKIFYQGYNARKFTSFHFSLSNKIGRLYLVFERVTRMSYILSTGVIKFEKLSYLVYYQFSFRTH